MIRLAQLEDEASQGGLSLEGFETQEEITLPSLPEEVVEEEIQITAEAPEQDEQRQAFTTKPEPAAAPSAPSKPQVMSSGTLADELDDEIVEIFLEEADEEHGNISRLLPHWQNNPQDGDTLKDLRRSFHTLKGSGRLVGAVDVGEFAWSFENLLNRVIDKSIKPDKTMFELLEQARNTLPGLFDLFRNGQKPGQDVYHLM